jgi:hypothetical protein
MEKILKYLDNVIAEYERRREEWAAYYYDGRLDAYREIYNIVANMIEEGHNDL